MAAEGRSLVQKEWSRVQASEMKFIRAIKSKTRWDRIRN